MSTTSTCQADDDQQEEPNVGSSDGFPSMPAQETLDVDALAAATLDCPAVAGLHTGGTKFVATYLRGAPGRRCSRR